MSNPPFPIPAKPSHPPVLLTGKALVGMASPEQMANVERTRKGMRYVLCEPSPAALMYYFSRTR